MTDWKSIITKIAKGEMDFIASGTFKAIYKDKTGKVYSKEKIRRRKKTNIYEILQVLQENNDLVRKHVLIPEEIFKKAGFKYTIMSYCEADLNNKTGNTTELLKGYTVEELRTNFSNLEDVVQTLHGNRISCMDIKPANMLFSCGEEKLIKLIDLDGSLVDGKGTIAQTLNYNFLMFNEDFKKQDKFALYKSFIEILDPESWKNYNIMAIQKTMQMWTAEIREKMKKDEKAILIEKYLKKLEELESMGSMPQIKYNTSYKL